MTTAKRQALAEYVHYALCDGQREDGAVGYAPLPLAVASAGLTEVALLQAADPGVDLTGLDVNHCANPTFTDGPEPTDLLPSTAPQPPACSRAGAPPCGIDTIGLVGPSARIVVYGQHLTLTGSLTDNDTGLGVSADVDLEARPVGSTVWSTVAQTRSANGTFTFLVSPRGATSYRFQEEVRSGRVPVGVAAGVISIRQSISGRLSATRVRVGATAQLRGLVAPGVAGQVVSLQVSRGGSWQSVSAQRLVHKSLVGGTVALGYAFAYTPMSRGQVLLRVISTPTPIAAAGVTTELSLVAQ